MIRNILFDLDGTLADTDPDIRLAWKASLADLGLECPNFDTDFVAGPPLEEMAAKLLGENIYTDAIGSRLRERFGYHYDHDGFPLTKEYPGMREVVSSLKEKGMRIFVATNKRLEGAVAMAKHFAWDGLFERIWTGDMFRENPAIGKMRKPQLLAYIIREMKFIPSETVMIGDTANDFDAARENGICSVAVRWGYGTQAEIAQADFAVASPSDIPKLSIFK